MQLWEIFDARLDTKWEKRGSFELTQFRWDDKTFVIQLGQLRLPIKELLGKKIVEVSFFRKDISGDKAFSTTDESENPVKVYGVVLNAVLDKFPEHDVFYFSAERRHSKNDSQHSAKVRIYDFISDRIQKKTGCYLYRRQEADRDEFILSKIPISNNAFVDELKEAVASLPTSNIPSI